MISDMRKTPWPWFGGKADAAPQVWEALGDVEHYVEPFAGSLAVLLRRPHPCNRTYYSETVNDLDGLLCNAWRAIARNPDEVAEAASWPVCEADLHARHLALVRWRAERQLEHLMGDPTWCDPVMAGWWVWGQSCWIGSGWCSGEGGWSADDSGRLARAPKTAGVSRKRPHLGDDGQGVNHAGLREPGVSRQLPHLGNNGQGVNHAGLREPGVSRKRPHLGDDGQGVNAPQLREPGVSRQLPHLGSNGQGVNHAALREPGVGGEPEYHPMTMPALRSWLRYLSARLRHVRILNGDWRRACTSGALKHLSVRQGGHAGIFLDPPYSHEVRDATLYTEESATVADDVRAWCEEHGTDPRYRIVLAGFDTEHVALEAKGWRAVEWYRAGFLRGGMANTRALEDGEERVSAQHRERLWFSPHCLGAARQRGLFDALGGAL